MALPIATFLWQGGLAVDFTVSGIDEVRVVFPRLHVITVTNIDVGEGRVLVPQPPPMSWIQEVTDGTNYAYVTTNGGFLERWQPLPSGTIVRKAPRWSSWVAAFTWIWSFPWRLLLLLAVLLILAATGGTLMVLARRVLASRRRDPP